MNKQTLSILGIFIALQAFNCQASEIPGFYLGVGGGWNTFDETFSSKLSTSATQSGNDHYNTSNSRLSPLVQVGYWAPICSDWLWGVSAQWSYAGYKTPNVNTSRGQYIPNATFSSINIFGPKVIRDFSSQTRLNNEASFFAYLGTQVKGGHVYLGVGPALFTATNNIYVSSIHTPSGTGDILTSGSVSDNKILWGGAVQLGYNYYVNQTVFLNANYTYLQTFTSHFDNTINASILNGFDVPGARELNLNRSIDFRVQQLNFSINKVFC